MKALLALALSLSLLVSCKEKGYEPSRESLDELARHYVKLALFIGQYDEPFVDAYYGPDSLRPAGQRGAVFPKDSLIEVVRILGDQLELFEQEGVDSLLAHRAGWIRDQLTSFDRRIRIFSGEYGTFDEESRDLFGAVAPQYDSTDFESLIAEMDQLLPGKGDVADRFQNLANRFIIPKEKLDTVMRAAIAECRKRTLAHYPLPANEDFKLEFVTNKSWSGYNWYKGNYQSVIQINTDLNIFIDRAIDVGSHESYPGHHVYNMLLEKNLYAGKGLIEISLYPLFSPQSLIAEGSANYGIDVVFPGNDKAVFAKNVLLPLAGLDTTGAQLYFDALSIRGKLNYVRNEVGRKLLSGAMTDDRAMRWLVDYGLYNTETAAKSVSFIKANRSYVINYNYGMDLVKAWVEKEMGDAPSEEKRWAVFGKLLSNEVRIRELLPE